MNHIQAQIDPPYLEPRNPFNPENEIFESFENDGSNNQVGSERNLEQKLT